MPSGCCGGSWFPLSVPGKNILFAWFTFAALRGMRVLMTQDRSLGLGQRRELSGYRCFALWYGELPGEQGGCMDAVVVDDTSL
jgi:hypothetical protein